MSKTLCALIFVSLVFGLCLPLVADDQPGDAAILEQLTPAQQAKWRAASEAQKTDWRVRWRLQQEQKGVAPSRPGAATSEVPTDIGRLRYDTGVPADLFSTNGGNTDQTVGNRFTADELTNTTLTMLTITAVSLYGRSVGTADPFDPGFSFFEAPVGTTAATIGYRGAATNFPRMSLVPVGIGAVTVPQTFLAAMYQGTFAGSDEIGMVTDSRIANNGTSTTPLGFHAFQMDFNSGAGSGYTPIAGQNAMLRVLGTAILPVELMTFEIE